MMSCTRLVKGDDSQPLVAVTNGGGSGFKISRDPSSIQESPFGDAITRHLEALHRQIVWEHERALLETSPQHIQLAMKAMQAENDLLRSRPPPPEAGGTPPIPVGTPPIPPGGPPPAPPELRDYDYCVTDENGKVVSGKDVAVLIASGNAKVADANGENTPGQTQNGSDPTSPASPAKKQWTSENGGESTTVAATAADRADEVSLDSKGEPKKEIPRICECGNVFKGDATFCRKCGKRRKGICQCGNILAVDAVFCRKCGRPAEDADNPKVERAFEVWPAWTKTYKNAKERHLTKVQSDIIRGNTVESKDDEGNQVQHKKHTGIVNPESKRYLWWQLLFTVVLCYELILFPMATFDIPREPGSPLHVLAWFCILFWSCDLVLTFFTGYYNKEGELVMQMKKIARHYSRTWLVPDAAVVLVDWVDVAGPDGASGGMKFAKLLRYLRMFRLLRLLRLRKLREAVHQVDEYINSVYFSIIKTLVLNIVMMLIISHFLGCFWYWVGRQEFDGYDSWVEHYGFDQREWMYSYLTSLHWAICQFTPGGMHVQPQNNAERIFGILMLVLGMIIFSSIVSNITRATTDLRNITARYDRQLASMRRFFRQQSISLTLLRRVTNYAENVIKPRMRGVQIHEVELIGSLPKPMHMEVIGELYDRHLLIHDLFKTIKFLNVIVMQKICFELKCHSLSSGGSLFSFGENAHSMFVILDGKVVYENSRTSATEVLGANSCVVEVVLWTPWVYQGKLSSQDCEVDMVSIASQDFQNILSQHPGTIWLAKKYATAFVDEMCRMEKSGEVISDLISVPAALEICKNA